MGKQISPPQLDPAVGSALDLAGVWLAAHGARLLGALEIGSRARGEATPQSDHDLRLVIESTEPYLILQERSWGDRPDVAACATPWSELNGLPGVTCGLTNLAYVRRCTDFGYFPLSDHTSLFQGATVDDPSGALRQFIAGYEAVRFANIVPDYTAQTRWRMATRLPAEYEAALAGEGLDAAKLAVPFVHTCCRILRDLAQIESYESCSRYVPDLAALDRYYQQNRQSFYSTFQSLFTAKTGVAQRRIVFEAVQARDHAVQRWLTEMLDAVNTLWHSFMEAYGRDR